MSSQSGRRTPPRGGRPHARSGPGRSSTSRSAAPAPRASKSAASSKAKSTSGAIGSTGIKGPVGSRAKPRFTGRAAILVIVLAVLAVSYASSLRAYLQQRAHLESLQGTIVERQGQIDDYEREKLQWQDPQYVETQVRLRLGMVMPGETPYVVLDDGQPLEAESTLTDPNSIDPPTPRAWWVDTWDSVQLAGNPQRRTDPPPLTRIEDPEGAPDG